MPLSEHRTRECRLRRPKAVRKWRTLVARERARLFLHDHNLKDRPDRRRSSSLLPDQVAGHLITLALYRANTKQGRRTVRVAKPMAIGIMRDKNLLL